MKQFINLFLTFFKMGCLTFGGGYAMLPVVEREVIARKGWITREEVLDYYTIAQVTPGVIAVNVSTFIGYKRKGVGGGIVATLGFILPGITLVTIIALCVQRFASFPAFQSAFAGVRVAVAALILDTVLKLCKSVFKDRAALIIFILAFALSAFLSLSPVLLILAAGLAGFCRYRGRRV
jgi:chromate transporter